MRNKSRTKCGEENKLNTKEKTHWNLLQPWMFSGCDCVQERRRRSSANSGTVWYAYRVANRAEVFRGRSVLEHLVRRTGPSRTGVRLESTSSSWATTVWMEVRFDVDVHQATGIAKVSCTARSTISTEFFFDQVLNTSVRILGGAAGNTVAVTTALKEIGSSLAKHFILVVIFRMG